MATRSIVAVLLAAGALGACASASQGATTAPVATTNAAATAASTAPASTTAATGEPGAVRVALVGDVMLGRGVDAVLRNDPGSVVDQLRPVLVGADLALGNLESPLTARPHVTGTNALEADPAAAAVLAGAGFAGMGIANNHAGDAGPDTVLDTMHAVTGVGLRTIGGGADLADATAPVVFVRHGVRIAVLAFDLTGGGPTAGAGPGVATWDDAVARRAVAGARAEADIVIVGVHGGVEYLSRPDPSLAAVVDELTAWGVDVVWGTGAHVPYPVTVVAGPDGRRTVQAPGLGNALFDQHPPGTGEGTLLEVLVDRHGVLATRTGRVATYLRARFEGWDDPSGDAVALAAEWWSPAAPLPRPGPAHAVPPVPGLPAAAMLVDADRSDIDSDGVVDVVAAYRAPAEPKLLQQAFPGVSFVDALGRAAHLAVYRADGTLRWGAGTMELPVAALSACAGAIAVAYSQLDDPAVTAGGAWQWHGFGFTTAPVLSGAAVPICIDLVGDGRTVPALIRTSGG